MNSQERMLSSFDVNLIVVRDRACPLPKIKQRVTSIVAINIETNERFILSEGEDADTSEHLVVVNTGTRLLQWYSKQHKVRRGNDELETLIEYSSM